MGAMRQERTFTAPRLALTLAEQFCVINQDIRNTDFGPKIAPF